MSDIDVIRIPRPILYREVILVYHEVQGQAKCPICARGQSRETSVSLKWDIILEKRNHGKINMTVELLNSRNETHQNYYNYHALFRSDNLYLYILSLATPHSPFLVLCRRRDGPLFTFT